MILFKGPDDHESVFDVDWLLKHHYGQPYETFTLL